MIFYFRFFPLNIFIQDANLTKNHIKDKKTLEKIYLITDQFKFIFTYYPLEQYILLIYPSKGVLITYSSTISLKPGSRKIE